MGNTQKESFYKIINERQEEIQNLSKILIIII